MKTLRSLFAVITVTVLFTASASASGPDSTNANSIMKIFTPVYKTLHDCEITYYIIKINGENVLMDNKGRVVKYLCDDDKLNTPESYEVVSVPANLLIR